MTTYQPSTDDSSEEQLTLWQEAHRAKTYRLQDGTLVSQDDVADCSGINVGLLMSVAQSGSSGKTSVVRSHQTRVLTSAPCCGDLLGTVQKCPRTGGSPQECASVPDEQQSGECWTLKTSESPNDAVVSLLSQVLETDVESKYLLSHRAVTGILKRATNKGKTLPPLLEAALRATAARQTETN